MDAAAPPGSSDSPGAFLSQQTNKWEMPQPTMGFHGDLMGLHGDLMGFNGDFMGFHGDFMGL